MKIELKSYIDKPSASKLELEQFRDGHIWRDISSYIETLLAEARELSDVENDIFEIKKIQGSILVAKDILNLPDSMIETIEEDQALDTGDSDG